MKTIKYLVVYEWTNSTGQGTGNIDIKTNLPIGDIKKVRELENGIATKCGFDHVVIINFIKLGECENDERRTT